MLIYFNQIPDDGDHFQGPMSAVLDEKQKPSFVYLPSASVSAIINSPAVY